MSWNGINPSDITDAEEFKVELKDGQLLLTWVCPRCGAVQTSEVKAEELVFGKQITCSNTEVCGVGECYFELKLEVLYGSYKGHADLPLKLTDK
jgi:hypothetical protein